MILFGLIFTVQSAVDLFFPSERYPYPVVLDGNKEITKESEELYEKNREIEEQNRLNRSKKKVVKSVAVVVIALPVFVYHWRKIEAERKLERGSE